MMEAERVDMVSIGPWADDDRGWFANHPGQSWRLRDPHPEEIEGQLNEMELRAGAPSTIHIRTAMLTSRDILTMKMLVGQIEVGERIRIPVFSEGIPSRLS